MPYNNNFVAWIIVSPHLLRPLLSQNRDPKATDWKLTLSSTHLSRSLFSLNSQRRPEEVMQKVLSAFLPLPHATSVKKLFLSSPSRPERPSKGTVAFTWKKETTRQRPCWLVSIIGWKRTAHICSAKVAEGSWRKTFPSSTTSIINKGNNSLIMHLKLLEK